MKERFEAFADFKKGQPFFRDRYRLSGSGISSAIRFVLSNRKRAKTADLDPFAVLESRNHGIENPVDYRFSPTFGNVSFFRNRFYQLRLGHIYKLTPDLILITDLFR